MAGNADETSILLTLKQKINTISVASEKLALQSLKPERSEKIKTFLSKEFEPLKGFIFIP